jgi:hypothetical protein
LEKVVEDLMKEQHKGMLRSLKAGEFDEAFVRYNAGQSAPSRSVAEASPSGGTIEGSAPAASPAQSGSPTASPSAASLKVEQKKPTVEASLDEIILSYLMGDEK